MQMLVKKNITVRIYPSKVDKNDNGEKIANITKIDSNMGIRRFIYNQELEFIKDFKRLLIQYGYGDDVKIIVNDSSCSVILEMLRHEYSFLEKSESSSRQQAQRDLIKAFKRYYDQCLKSEGPVFKSKKNQKNLSFRIMNNNNNVRITPDKNGYDKIKLAKLGLVKFTTSKEYHQLLCRGSDITNPDVKIKHVTVKKVNDKYFAVFNVEYIYVPENIMGPKMKVGIDIGCGKLAVLSNGLEIPNLDLENETDTIIKYQKCMSHHQKGSIRYREAQKLYNKAWEKFLNKRKDYYNKLANCIAKNCSFVAVQNENIIAWKNNRYLSRKIQLNAPRDFMDRLEKKCQQEGVEFVKISKFFPSTKKCSKCNKINKNISGLENLKIRDWDCPNCHTHHDRDRNAAINILNEGLKIVGTTVQ